MDLTGISFHDYKCFKYAEINNLKPINIIIGKNNIGKSSVLDIIEMIYSKDKVRNNNITLEKRLTNNDISKVFKDYMLGGGIPTSSDYEFGKLFIGKPFVFDIYKNVNGIATRSSSSLSKYSDIYDKKYSLYWEKLAISVEYNSKNTKRILAERNIFPEIESESMEIDGNGNGITTVITNFINKSQYNENLVKTTLLSKLNEIMGEDANFTEIITQQVKQGEINKWEIFLREEEKGRISLSNSGSGLKTILMVLVYTILVPEIEKQKMSNYIFMFEELENNLHPSLQRRLLKYIESLSTDDCIFFLTTHSNVMLDNFQNNENVNMLHVVKSKNNNMIEIINTTDSIQKNEILDDLGIKASDIFQSNGIIWVEGPSDRIYINKWIDLWSNGTIREGRDYQCLFYGGRLLSNLALDENEENDLINLLNINRNSIILIDSDKKNRQAPINNTKKRIQEEASNNKIMCWITKGREIENYLSGDLIIEKLNLKKKNLCFGQYQNIEEFLEKQQKSLGVKFLRNKNFYAKTFVKNVQIDDYKHNLDLDEKMNCVIDTIKRWNYDE